MLQSLCVIVVAKKLLLCSSTFHPLSLSTLSFWLCGRASILILWSLCCVNGAGITTCWRVYVHFFCPLCTNCGFFAQFSISYIYYIHKPEFVEKVFAKVPALSLNVFRHFSLLVRCIAVAASVHSTAAKLPVVCLCWMVSIAVK